MLTQTAQSKSTTEGHMQIGTPVLLNAKDEAIQDLPVDPGPDSEKPAATTPTTPLEVLRTSPPDFALAEIHRVLIASCVITDGVAVGVCAQTG